MRPVKYFDTRTLKNTYFNNFYMINDILCLKEEKMSTSAFGVGTGALPLSGSNIDLIGGGVVHVLKMF